MMRIPLFWVTLGHLTKLVSRSRATHRCRPTVFWHVS